MVALANDRRGGSKPVIDPWNLRAMMQSEIENKIRALRSDLEEIVKGAQSRENEWRRLGLISSVSGILLALVGAGFLIANVVIERTSTNLFP
jgi:hypothetical protein